MKFVIFLYAVFLLPIANGCKKNNKIDELKPYSVQENHNDSIISKTYYKNGNVESVYYDKNRKKDELFFESYRIDGTPIEKQLKKDSLIINKNDSCRCIYLSISYFSNKKVKEIGCQGEYNTMGIPVGTWETFDSIGRIKERIYYHPDKYGKDYKIIQKYNEIGKLISEKIFNNDIQYENELNELKKIP